MISPPQIPQTQVAKSTEAFAMHAARLVLLGLALLTLAVACWLTGCGSKTESPDAAANAVSPETDTAGGSPSTTTSAKPKPAPPKPVDPIVVLHTSAGEIKLKLYAEKSPQTVDNFLNNYARRGFYDQTIFHHIEPGMMLIGGGFTSDLQPKETRAAIYNESRNGLSNRKGTVAMIHEAEAAHSATSQFFVNLVDNPSFDFQVGETEDTFGYCVFGEVVEGMEIVEQIAAAPTSAQGDFPAVPTQTVMIERVEQLR
jgi:peptidyl-prolyl cis-trans isomerase A (cyclophilin A)/peptidyl-prolyl cis-trans isomerase B (cyclophilin B)